MMDKVVINVRGRYWRPWNYLVLYRLMWLVCIKSQIISNQNPLTTDLLTTRPKLILRRIKEEQTELTLAIRFQVDCEIVMESVDLIHQVLLLARSIGLNINNVIRFIDYKTIKVINNNVIRNDLTCQG